MEYDLSRTRDIVHRLTLLGNKLMTALVLIGMVQYGVLFWIVGTLVAGSIGFVFLLIGVIVGAGVGVFTANALSVLIEWMAQMLISLQKD